MLLVRARLGAVGHRAGGCRQRPLRDGLPAPDQHVAGAGQHRRATRRLSAGALRFSGGVGAPQDSPRQRRPPLPVGLSMDVERALQELIDRQQIEDTLYRYGSSIDCKDYPTLRSLFADDAVGQYGERPAIHGADEIVRWIEDATRDRAWQHHKLTVYHVDVAGDEA